MGALHYPPLHLEGVYLPLDFYKVTITLKTFDFEQVIYDHRQVRQAKKKGDKRKRLAQENEIIVDWKDFLLF